MRGFVIGSIAGAAALFSAQAFADESSAPGQAPKHLLADCMNRRMAADRALSYINASKACKEQIKSRKADSASNNVQKPVG